MPSELCHNCLCHTNSALIGYGLCLTNSAIIGLMVMPYKLFHNWLCKQKSTPYLCSSDSEITPIISLTLSAPYIKFVKSLSTKTGGNIALKHACEYWACPLWLNCFVLF